MINLSLPIAFAIIGFIFSTRSWLKFLNKQNPIKGLIIYYIVLTITIIILQSFGLVVGNTKFDTFKHTIGTILIIFSFFIIIDWTSCYTNEVNEGQCDTKNSISQVYLQSEDGATYWLWSKVFKGKDKIQIRRIMTFVITPFILSLIGTMLITSKVSLSVI